MAPSEFLLKCVVDLTHLHYRVIMPINLGVYGLKMRKQGIEPCKELRLAHQCALASVAHSSIYKEPFAIPPAFYSRYSASVRTTRGISFRGYNL